MNKYAAVLLILILTLVSFSYGQTTLDTTRNTDLYKTLDQVKAIMKGAEFQQVSQYISPEAFIISGKTFGNLAEVVRSKERASALQENADRQTVQVTARTNETEDAIYVVLKTVSAKGDDPRYHSLVLYKEPGTVWQIYLWHVGL